MERTTIADAVISANGRITLPEAVRCALNLREGDYMSFMCEDDHVVLTKLSQGEGKTELEIN